MYPHGLATIDRVTGDLNREHMEDIRTEVQAERRMPAPSFFNTVKHLTISLYERILSASKMQPERTTFIEGDCEGAVSPCG